MTDDQINDLKAAKEKLEKDAQAVFTKMYEEQAKANGGAGAAGGAGAGPDMGGFSGAQGSTDNGNGNDSASSDNGGKNDYVVDGDFREV